MLKKMGIAGGIIHISASRNLNTMSFCGNSMTIIYQSMKQYVITAKTMRINMKYIPFRLKVNGISFGYSIDLKIPPRKDVYPVRSTTASAWEEDFFIYITYVPSSNM